MKVLLYYNTHYDESNLIDVQEFMQNTLEKLLDNQKFKTQSTIKILRSPSETDFFFFQVFKFKGRTLFVNSDLSIMLNHIELSNLLNISDNFIEILKDICNVKFYIKLNYNTNLLWLILTKIFQVYCPNIKKLIVYQVGLSTIDEEIYTILAHYLATDNSINSINLKSKSIEEFTKDEVLNFSQADDMKILSNIQNKQHFFNFYQILSKKTHLIEISIILFITEYNLILLTDVVRNNLCIEKISIRNMIYASNYSPHELDFSLNFYHNLGEKIKDEIYCFFNFCFRLNNLKTFKFTHVWFNSEINFFTCELAKNVKSLREIDLTENQAIVRSDEVLRETFSFAETSLTKLNMSRTYFYLIRSFKNFINCEVLKDLDVGVLDFVSTISLLKFIRQTRIEVLKLTLNKRCDKSCLPVLFEFIKNFALTSRFLKFMHMNNTYSMDLNLVENMNFMVNLLSKFITPILSTNMIIRTLSFQEHSCYISEINDFRYIQYSKYNNCHYILWAINRLLKGEEIINLQIIRRVLVALFIEKRKIII